LTAVGVVDGLGLAEDADELLLLLLLLEGDFIGNEHEFDL
jgi:hypothetical protein